MGRCARPAEPQRCRSTAALSERPTTPHTSPKRPPDSCCMAQAADRQVARIERALKREDNNKAPEAIVTEALRVCLPPGRSLSHSPLITVEIVARLSDVNTIFQIRLLFLFVVLLSRARLQEHDLKDSGRGPLHLAAQQGHAAVVKLLIAGGANIFRLDFAGNTPLMLAMRNGHEEVIGLLRKAEGSRANRKLKQKALQTAVVNS